MWQLLGLPLEEHCYPQSPLFCSDGVSRTGLQCQQLLSGAHTWGFREHGRPQVLARAFLPVWESQNLCEQRLTGPVRSQAKSSAGAAAQGCWESVLAALGERDRLPREHRSCDISAPRTGSSCSQPDLGKKANQTQISLYFRKSSCSTSLPRAGCTAGDKCKDFTRLSKHPRSWDTCLHAGGPMAKLLLIHLSISQEKIFLCTVPLCYLLNKILPH